MFLLHVLLFAVRRGWNSQFHSGNLSLPPGPFSWAPLQAQSVGIPTISNTLEFWGGNMWGIWMIDPPLLLHPLPLSLLSVTCWVGGEDSGGLVVWTRLLHPISDTVEEDSLTYRMMPPELKTEGLCCVRWLVFDRVRGFSSKSWPPWWRRCPVCPHDENDMFLSKYFDIFKHISCTTCDSCSFLSLSVRLHVHYHGCKKLQYMD